MKQWQQITSYIFAAFMAGAANLVAAEPIDAALAAKVEEGLKTITQWAADPAVINAAKEASSKGAGDMNNAKWTTLADSDPAIAAVLNHPLSEKIRGWESKGQVQKILIRDDKANLVAAGTKALLFNNASRPHIKAALAGNPGKQDEAKPDPTTQVLSVQIAVPIKDGDKIVGVLNAAVDAK